MRMKKQLLLLALFFCGTILFAQEPTNQQSQYDGKSVDLFASVRMENAKFHIYDPPFAAKGIYTKIEDAKCLTPEALLESMESETNQAWVDHNNLPGESDTVPADAFAYRKKLDKNTNYYELIHKLSFSYNGIPTAIIKYYFVEDGKRTILASMTVQKKNGCWYRTCIAGLDHLEAIVCRVKSKNLAMLLETNIPDDATDFMKKIKNDDMGEQRVFDSEKLFGVIEQMSKSKKMDALLLLIDKSNP
jgi:hypothetical protein